jgi:23S rRNA (guanosine2251-2'-O)-methyltransferase
MNELIYGYHPVREALKAGKRHIKKIFITEGKRSSRFADIRSLAKAAQVPVQHLSPNEIDSMVAVLGNQGICASSGPFQTTHLDELLQISIDQEPLILLIDQVVDPQNLGALIRTAYCAGLHGVIITKDRSAGPSPAVSKASAGAMEHISLTRITNMVTTIKRLKKEGIWVAGLEGSEGQSIYATDLTGPLALVVGSEEKGIRPLVKKNCDLLVAIPQIGNIDSLNASVAGGVVMYEAYRQRNINFST